MSGRQRSVAAATALACACAQVTLPPPDVEASHLGSTIASAGSAPPPAATLIESFQPDLFTGRATTAIPIVVPPGRRGLAPTLALSYASSSRNGPVGVGWSLEVGAIERSTKRGVPTYDGSDTFTLQMGGVHSELVKIPDGTYRLKDEGLFLKVEDLGVSGWQVTDKAGTTYFFGSAQGSGLGVQGKLFRWALDRVEDIHGNTLTISYTKDQGQLYLAGIQYTGHPSTGLAPANEVRFILEDRPDVETSFRSGFAVTTAKRLKDITVTAQGQLVRRYRLAYATSARTGRSLLASVTQVGSDGVSPLPPVSFTYQAAAEATYTLTSNTGLSGSNLWNVTFKSDDWGDTNGAPLYPSQVRSYGAPIYTQSSGSHPGMTWSIDSQGNLSVGADRDMNLLFWTYVFVASAKTVSVTLSQSEDSQIRFFLNGSLSEVPGWPTKSLALQAGWNLVEVTSYNQNAGFGWSAGGSLAAQVDIMNPTQFIQPALSGDFNGDGLTDLALFDQPSGTWKVGVSCGCSFKVDAVWLTGFGSTGTAPVLGDWDGDGRTDLATYHAGSWRFARSTGASFQADALPALSFGSGTPLIGDFNGDGKLDLGTYNNGSWSVALGNGSGFASAGTFHLSWGGSQHEPLTGDFNGDGLTDIGLAHTPSGTLSVALSNGSAFVIQPADWRDGFGAGQEHLVADFNGDGLSDVAYYDRASGQATYVPSTGTSFASPKTASATFSMRDANDQTQVGDYNGDGVADPAAFDPITGQGELAFSNGAIVDLLSTQTNGLGGTATFSYISSGLLDNTGGDGLPDLPFVVPVVERVTLSDGMGNSYTTRYAYAGGRYEAPAKEFRGFAEVTLSDPAGTKTQTLFHQDAQKKGRAQQVTVSDKDGTRYTKLANTWRCAEPSPGSRFCALSRQVSTTFDGDATSKQAAVAYDYDAFGNVTTVTEEGDTSVLGDERVTRVSYALNTTDWLVNRPATITVFGADGVTTLKDQRFFYDHHPALTDPPTLGNLTSVEEWFSIPVTSHLSPDTSSLSPDTWWGTTLGYDLYGNVTSVTDPLARTTSLAYDVATHTFLESLTNALGHTQRFQRDARFGVVTSTTDSNGVTTLAVADVFGRPSALIGPTDTQALPTIRYEYDLTSVPTRTVVHTRLTSGRPDELTSYQFTDGLGRTIQTRSPAEDPQQQIVTGAVEFDARGLVVKQWTPYLDTGSASYRPPSLVTGPPGHLATVTYTYDPLGRLTQTTDPDGSTTTVAYDDWAVVVTDANGHPSRTTYDAYARPVIVEEFNGTALSTTAYQYDPLDHLTQVTDTAGNRTRMTYDSLSRKVAMDDPDMDTWTYAYDAVDNLLSQTDARGVITSFTYDALNRLIRKEYGDTVLPCHLSPVTSHLAPNTCHLAPVTYSYDDPTVPFAVGRLTAISDGSGSSSFEYDSLGHVIEETKTVDGTPYIFQGSFDLLDRLTSLTYPDGETAAYTYNPQGGLETLQLQSIVHSPQSIVTNVDYNAVGQVTRLALGNGATTDYSYDPLTLRLTGLTTGHPSSGTLQDFRYTYDPVGNLTRIDDHLAEAGTQTFAYDDLDRLTLASGPYGAPSFSYDATGNLTAKGATTLTYGNPDGGQPHAVTAVHSPQSVVRSLRYDPNGNLIENTTDDGLPTTDFTAQRFTYDAESRLVQVETPTTETVSVRLEPGWNFFALPVIPDDFSISAIFPTFGTDFDQISRYNPDTDAFEDYVGHSKFDDFTSLEYGRGYEVYCANPAGVTLTLTGQTPTRIPSFTLDTGSHLIGSSALAPQSTAWLLGDLVSGADYDTVHRYEPAGGALAIAAEAKPAEAYFLHALKSATWQPPLPKDVSTRFTYDSDGERVAKVGASGRTTYVGELYEVDAAGATKHLFAGGQRIASVVSSVQLPASSIRFYHPDHLGSTHVVTDALGAEQARFAYSPFGEVVSATSSSGHLATGPLSHFGFTGQRFDPETGLYFYHARYYDPALGRFLSADPLVQDPTDPQFLNRFAYVRNNPLRFVDPSGLTMGETASAIVGNGLEWLSGLSALGWTVLGAAIFFGFKALFGRGKAAPPSLPPGPISPTPFTPLTSLTGVSFAPLLHGAQGAGGFVADSVLNIRAIQDSATLLRVGEGGEKAFAAIGLTALVTDAILNVGTLGGKAALTGGMKAGGRGLLGHHLASSIAEGVPRSRALIPRNFETLAPHGGFLGGFRTSETLRPGMVIDRFGSRRGTFASPAGTPFSKRGLPPEAALRHKDTLRVLKPLDVEAGIAAPAFGGGLGIQFKLPATVQELIDAGVLEVK